MTPNYTPDPQEARNHGNRSLVARWAQAKFKRKEESYLDDITLKRLLSHTAGLDTHGIGTADEDRRGETLDVILMGRALDPAHNGVKPENPPGYVYSYLGGGYTVAEAMLEVETGLTFSDYMTRNVLAPLGLTRSTFDTASSAKWHLAWGCNKKKYREPELTRVKAAGGLLAHPEDMATLIFMIGNDGKDQDGRQVIPLEDIQKVLTPAFNIQSATRPCSGTCDPIMIPHVPGLPAAAIIETCFQGKCQLC